MSITVRGKNKTEVQDRVNDFLEGIEKQQKFNHTVSVQKTDNGWEGTVEIFWHKESYPSHYGTDTVPQLPVGDKSEAVDRIYGDKNIKKR